MDTCEDNGCVVETKTENIENNVDHGYTIDWDVVLRLTSLGVEATVDYAKKKYKKQIFRGMTCFSILSEIIKFIPIGILKGDVTVLIDSLSYLYWTLNLQ